MALSPYLLIFIGSLIAKNEIFDCDLSTPAKNHWWLFLVMTCYIPRFIFYKYNLDIYHGYSNLTLSLAVCIIGLVFLPLAISIGITVVPLKIVFYYKHKLNLIFYALMGLIMSFAFRFIGSTSIMLEEEVCTGHNLWSYFMYGLMATYIQLAYFVIKP